MWLSRVPTFWPAAYPSSSLVVFCIFNLLIITHHSGRFCVILANCFMVSFVKALATRTTVCCAARSHYVYVIFVVGAWENHNMNYICVCFNFRQTTWATACFVVAWVGGVFAGEGRTTRLWNSEQVTKHASQCISFSQSVLKWRWSGSQQSGYFIYVSEANHSAPQLWPIKKLLSTIRCTHCVLISRYFYGVMVDSIVLRIAEGG